MNGKTASIAMIGSIITALVAVIALVSTNVKDNRLDDQTIVEKLHKIELNTTQIASDMKHLKVNINKHEKKDAETFKLILNQQTELYKIVAMFRNN